jgi:oligosaccharide reducing-end xylanase
MKKVNEILLFAAFFMVVSNVGYSRTIDPPYEVGNWSGFRTAAITYTFDDHCSNQFAIAVPMFNEFGYKLSMFPVPGWSPNWTNIVNAAAAGHEIGSHTVNHTRLSDVNETIQNYQLSESQNIINSHITNQQCVTIVYPECVYGNLSLVATYYIAGRVCSASTLNPATPSNYYTIQSIILGNSGINTLAGITGRDDAAAASGGWCVFLIHGIDGDGGWSPISSTVLRQSLQYLDAHRNTFWVQTFGNVTRYIKERNDVSVTETANTDDSITLSVTDTLDNAIYNYPVTVRRPLPADWPSATVSQNGQAVNASVVVANSTLYVMFDVVPDGGDVVLSKSIYGDFICNGIVELNDISAFCGFWPVNDCNATVGVDLDEDCIVNFHEFAVLAENWL